MEALAEQAAIRCQARRDHRRDAILRRELEALSDGGLLLLLYAPDEDEDEDEEGELRPWDEWLVSLCDQVPADHRAAAEARLAEVRRWDSLGAVEAVGTVMPSDYWRTRFLVPSFRPNPFTG